MNQTEAHIRKELERVAAQYGGWTDHNIKVAENVYTIGRREASPKLRRIVQIVSDLAGQELSGLRILDLGCLEGGYAIEFALRGAEVVAIDGREANIAKVQVVKSLLGLDKLTIHKEDVRNISSEIWGCFDVVLCLGLLYHIDAPALFYFAERIAGLCGKLALFDTEVSTRACRSYKYRNSLYWGRDVIEHDPRSTREERLHELWGSLDNETSTWLTKPSLLNLLQSSGFSSVYECNVPVEPQKRADRLTLIAVKNVSVTLRSVEDLSLPAFRFPESCNKMFNLEQGRVYALRRRLTMRVPRELRGLTKRFLRRIGLMSKTPRFWELPWKIRHTAGQSGHADKMLNR